MKKHYVKLLLFVVLIMICGCAGSSRYMVKGSPIENPSPDKALVYFMRPSSMGFAINFQIRDGEHFIGLSQAKSYFAYECDPGKHLFLGFAENKIAIDADLEAGKSYFIGTNVRMGAWKMNDSTACLILSPGRVFTSDKKPQGLYYNDVTEMIKEHPRDSYYHKILKRPQTLSESIELNNLRGLGEVREFHTSIDINLARTSQDRIFKEFPHNGGELLSKKYHSEPITI